MTNTRTAHCGILGPPDGYDFGPKRDYRAKLWAMARKIHGSLATAEVCFMPSNSRAEIDAALAAGVQPERMHWIDRNPAVLATLKRQHSDLGAAHSYGVECHRALHRMAMAGQRLDVLNLDLCCPVHSSTMVKALYYACAMLPPFGLLFVTALRGRDDFRITPNLLQLDGISTDALAHWHINEAYRALCFGMQERWLPAEGTIKPDSVPYNDLRRVVSVHAALMGGRVPKGAKLRAGRTGFVSPLSAEIYRSGTQTMIWMCFAVGDESGLPPRLQAWIDERLRVMPHALEQRLWSMGCLA